MVIARNTVRERIAAATAAGFGQQGPPLSAAQWRAALGTAAAESDDDARRFPVRAALELLHEEIAQALKASTMTTVWQRLRRGRAADRGPRMILIDQVPMRRSSVPRRGTEGGQHE